MASSDMTIDNLQIKIETQASQATSGIDGLAASMEKLKLAVGDTNGLADNLTKVSTAIKTFSGLGRINLQSSVNQLSQLKDLIPILGSTMATDFATNLRDISGALQTFSTVPKVSITPIANGIRELNSATAALDSTRLAELSAQMQGIASALSHLKGIEKTNLNSTLNALKKIPEISKELDPQLIAEFASKIKELTEAIAPLSAEMDKIGRGFAALPPNIRKAIKVSDSVVNSNGRLQKSYGGLTTSLSRTATKFWVLYQAASRIVDMFANALNASNEYIEALNLFRVTMGETADDALAYAKTVNNAMGIDIAEWITNQGVFQRMSTGFGIAQDQADVMSQNLTQLAYDLSSFFNTDVETAMQKLQSGMSGQIKGLKAWGYNLSVAALQETALSLGIEQSVRTMTEAQKAQLRYITLIQKSQGIMGDMAKTINTPANSMRILSAQFTQFQRAVGNAVSVIVTKWIPYIQAFVEVMTEAAEALAVSWGFEIKDLPTNNLDMAADVIDGINDGVEDTIDNVSTLKKQLMGFDELNILKSDDAESGQGKSYDLGIEMPSYDFLDGLGSEIGERVDEIKKKIEEIIPLVKNLGAIFLAAFAVSTFNKAKAALIGFLATSSAGQTIALSWAAAMDLFVGMLKVTKNPLKALGASIKTLGNGFKTMMKNLSPATKGLVSIVALAVEFNVVKNSVKGVVDGSKSLGEALGGIIPVCAAVGVAMYTMLGPWGLVAAAAVGVVAAVVGTKEALDELETNIAHTALYDGLGTSISDLADDFNDLLDESTAFYDVILEKQQSILDAKENISVTKTEIDLLVSEVTNGATTIEAAIPRIEKAFQNLYDNTKNVLIGTASLLYAALTGSTIEGIETYMQTISKVTNTTIEEIEKSNKRIEEAKKQFDAGEITKEQYWDVYIEETLKTSNWTTASSQFETEVNNAKNGFSELLGSMSDIDWAGENPEYIKTSLESIKTGYDEAKATIESAYDAIYSSIADLRHQAVLQGDTEAIGILDSLLAEYQAMETAELSNLDNQLGAVLYAMEEDIVEGVNKALADADKAWDSMNWFEKGLYGWSEWEFKRETVEEYFETAKNDIVSVMEGVFGKDALFLSDDVIDKILMPDIFGNFHSGNWSPDDASGTLERYFYDDGAYIVQGLVDGLSDEQKKAYDASRDMGKTVLEAFDEALKIHSPSVEMEDRGLYAIEGLVVGLDNNMGKLDPVLDEIVDKFDILSPIQTLWKKVTDWWKNISLPDIDLFGGFGAKIAGAFNIGQYASGGFPTMGSMFLASERGPELVGRIGNRNAVVNNDQIIAGIATAVYNAMMAAQEDGDNGGGNAKIVVQIGDQAVGEASVRYINGKIVQTGMSPIYG